MKYKCNKCEKVFTPKGSTPECPDCGSRNLDLVPRTYHAPQPNVDPKQE